nr:hypothetical protein [Rhodococcus qingshengii]
MNDGLAEDIDEQFYEGQIDETWRVLIDILPALTDEDSPVAHATETVGAARLRD